MSADSTQRWLIRLDGQGRPRARLICFPWAGAGAFSFRPLAAALSGFCEIYGVQPPGREDRFLERPLDRMAPLLDSLALASLHLLEAPYAFFGHSLGALVCFELCRLLRRMRRPLPQHLFLSSYPAAHCTDARWRVDDLSDSQLVDALLRFEGTPPEVLAHPEILRLTLPILRADFALSAACDYVDEPPLDVPITALGGTQDREVPPRWVEEWRRQTSRSFDLRYFRGGHFYFNDHLAEVASVVERAITHSLAAPSDCDRLEAAQTS